jgi:hypothetical protein
MDARDGLPTIECPECKANRNPAPTSTPPPLVSADQLAGRRQWFWALYECRYSVIVAAPDNSGFFAPGQEELWPWSHARILGPITEPDTTQAFVSADVLRQCRDILATLVHFNGEIPHWAAASIALAAANAELKRVQSNP